MEEMCMGPLADSTYRNDASVAESRKMRLQELRLPTIAFCLSFVQNVDVLLVWCLFWDKEIDTYSYKALGDRRTCFDGLWNFVVNGRECQQVVRDGVEISIFKT